MITHVTFFVKSFFTKIFKFKISGVQIYLLVLQNQIKQRSSCETAQANIACHSGFFRERTSAALEMSIAISLAFDDCRAALAFIILHSNLIQKFYWASLGILMGSEHFDESSAT